MKRMFAILLALLMAASAFAVMSLASDYPIAKRTYAAKDHTTIYILTKENVKGYEYDSGSYSYTRKFAYDKAYRLVKETQDTRVLTYRYDQNGNVTKHMNVYTVVGEGFDKTAVSYQYDKAGRITRITERYIDIFDGSYTKTDAYKYKDGRLIKHVAQKTADDYSSAGNSREVMVYSYDKNGRLIKTKDNYGNTTRYVYDKNGRITKEVEEYITTYYKYNANGDLVKKYAKENGINHVTEGASYQYDRNGLLTGAYYYADGGTSERYSYQYDKHGNLTKSVHKGYFDDGYLYTKETVTYSYKKVEKAISRTREGITLNAYSYTYDKKEKKPVVSIEGMLQGADYRVTYFNNIKPGKASVRIDFTDPTIQSVTVTYTIKKA